MEWFSILGNIASILGLIISCVSLFISASIRASLRNQQINKAKATEMDCVQQININ